MAQEKGGGGYAPSRAGATTQRNNERVLNAPIAEVWQRPEGLNEPDPQPQQQQQAPANNWAAYYAAQAAAQAQIQAQQQAYAARYAAEQQKYADEQEKAARDAEKARFQQASNTSQPSQSGWNTGNPGFLSPNAAGYQSISPWMNWVGNNIGQDLRNLGGFVARDLSNATGYGFDQDNRYATNLYNSNDLRGINLPTSSVPQTPALQQYWAGSVYDQARPYRAPMSQSFQQGRYNIPSQNGVYNIPGGQGNATPNMGGRSYVSPEDAPFWANRYLTRRDWSFGGTGGRALNFADNQKYYGYGSWTPGQALVDAPGGGGSGGSSGGSGYGGGWGGSGWGGYSGYSGYSPSSYQSPIKGLFGQLLNWRI